MSKECGCSNQSHSRWTGITRIQAESKSEQFPPAGDHCLVSLQLNSIHSLQGIYRHAFTVNAVEVLGGEMSSKISISAYAESTKMVDYQETELTLATSKQQQPVRDLKIFISPPEEIEIYHEASDGTFTKKTKKMELLKLTATVEMFGQVFTPKIHYAYGDTPPCPSADGLYTVTQCVHDTCGPSWAHYGCHYRCLVKICCASNGQCGDWSDLPGGVCGVDCF